MMCKYIIISFIKSKRTLFLKIFYKINSRNTQDNHKYYNIFLNTKNKLEFTFNI